MAVIDWNPTKFSAFAGPAKLDATFLKASLDPRSNKLLLDKDIVRVLMSHPIDTGFELIWRIVLYVDQCYSG